MGLLSWLFGKKPIPTPSPVPKPNVSFEEDLATLLDLHNAFRITNRKPRFTRSPILDTAAQYWANKMAEQSELSHEFRGSTLVERIEDAGYYPWLGIAENILQGASTAKQAFLGWTASAPHRHNLLGNYTSIGLGVACDKDGEPFWCVDFGSLQIPPALKDAYEHSPGIVLERGISLAGPIWT